jgi:prophage regulatory protein
MDRKSQTTKDMALFSLEAPNWRLPDSTRSDGKEVDMYDIPDADPGDLPKTGFLRLSRVLFFYPVGKTCWWNGVKSGRFPKPVKLSARCTAWRAEDIRELIKNLPDQVTNS